VNFETWEPVYEAIRADMGYDRAGDEAARDELATFVGDAATLALADASFDGDRVAIAAPGPGLSRDLPAVDSADVVVAAGVAADRLLDDGRRVDWVVTDLDGHADRVPRFTQDGIPVAIHAHGDNRDLLAASVPECDHSSVLPTTQAAPAGPVRNVGGFTDGDRAAFLADAVGADELVFPGWDLMDTTVGPTKRRKLRWAARLLGWLERRRGETFAVLDGVRDDLDRSMLPDCGL